MLRKKNYSTSRSRIRDSVNLPGHWSFIFKKECKMIPVIPSRVRCSLFGSIFVPYIIKHSFPPPFTFHPLLGLRIPTVRESWWGIRFPFLPDQKIMKNHCSLAVQLCSLWCSDNFCLKYAPPRNQDAEGIFDDPSSSGEPVKMSDLIFFNQ